MIEYLFVGLLAAVLAGLHRAAILWLYRSWFRQGFAGDAAFHLAVIRQIRRTGGYEGVPEFLIKDETDTYPILFHRFAVLFPERLVERYAFLPNAVIWVIATTAFALYTYYVATLLLDVESFRFVLLFILLFLTLASNLALDMNGLNYISLSERLLSRVCCGGYFLTLTIFLSYHDLPSLAAAVILGAMTLISSMFGRQAIAFITPLIALLAFNAWPLAILAVSLVAATIIDRGYFVRGLRHMSQYSYAYRRLNKHSRYYKSGLSRFVDVRKVLGRGAGLGARLHELTHAEPTRVLFRYPEAILAIGVWIVWPHIATVSEVAIFGATLIVYFATSTAALRHYGEANRYLEFALWPLSAFVLTKYGVLGPIQPAVWLAYGAWVLAVTIRQYRNWMSLSFPRSDVLGEFLQPLRLDRDSTVYSIPCSLGAAVHVRTRCRALMYQGSAVTLELYQKFMEEIPFLKRDWKDLALEFRVTHVIAERSYLDLTKPLLGWEYDFSKVQRVAENDRYVAYCVGEAEKPAVKQAGVESC